MLVHCPKAESKSSQSFVRGKGMYAACCGLADCNPTDRKCRMRDVQKPSQIVRALSFFLLKHFFLSLCKLE
jgi:hypothetical protein